MEQREGDALLTLEGQRACLALGPAGAHRHGQTGGWGATPFRRLTEKASPSEGTLNRLRRPWL